MRDEIADQITIVQYNLKVCPGMFGARFISSLCIIGAASARSDDSKIVGGRLVGNVTSIPFMISLQLKKVGHHCGGSLLTPLFVLTACHCLADVDEKPLYVYDADKILFLAGEVDFEGDKTHSQVREARALHVHPLCNKVVTVIHDFAVGEMKRSFQITEFVKPFRLLTTDPDEFGDKFAQIVSDKDSECQVAGWGETRRGMEQNPMASKKLKAVRMYVIPESDCQEQFGEREKVFETFPFLLYGQICAVSRFFNESDCVGDSGSPFFCGDYVLGVVSYGYECGTYIPSVYNGLMSFLDWFMSEVYPLRSGSGNFLNKTTKIDVSRESPISRDTAQSSDANKIRSWVVCNSPYRTISRMLMFWPIFC